MNDLFCPYSSCSLSFGFFDFLFVLVIVFFLLGSLTTPTMGLGNNCEITCFADGHCPFVLNPSSCSSPEKTCLWVKPKTEETPEEKAIKEQKQKIQTLVHQNQLLVYQLEQAQLNYSIQKVLSETDKLKTVSQNVPVSTDNTVSEDSIDENKNES